MNATTVISRALVVIVSICLLAGFALGQNVNLNGAGGTLSGTYNIKGNINTTNASGVYTYSGTVKLNGTTGGATQTIANGGGSEASKALIFTTLTAGTTSGKDIVQGGIVTVNGAFTLDAPTKSYSVGGNTLSFAGTTAIAGGSFDASNASSAVNFISTASQTILTSTYGGTLGISGAGAKSLGGVILAATVSHTSGGAVTVGENFTITGNTASTLYAISVSAGKTLTYQGTNALTIATVSSNLGTIQQTTGASGTIAFTNALSNAGTIQTGTGVLTYVGDLTNTGSVVLTNTGVANFNANILGVGTMTFATTSTVNYNSNSGQTLAGVSYGTLNMYGTGVKTAGNTVTIAAAFHNGTATTDMSTYSFAGIGTKDQLAGGTMRFGADNGLVFAVGTVEYNRASGTQIIAGDASATYATLVLSGGGTKQVATGASATVHTTGNLTVADAITLNVVSGGFLAVDTDLNIEGSGSITNDGEITVGL